MHNVNGMHILDAFTYLSQEADTSVLCQQKVIRDDSIVKLATVDTDKMNKQYITLLTIKRILKDSSWNIVSKVIDYDLSNRLYLIFEPITNATVQSVVVIEKLNVSKNGS